jgi:hypothetical protein
MTIIAFPSKRRAHQPRGRGADGAANFYYDGEMTVTAFPSKRPAPSFREISAARGDVAPAAWDMGVLMIWIVIAFGLSVFLSSVVIAWRTM